MTRFKTLIAGASIAAVSMSVFAEPVTLKLAHMYPADHYLWQQGMKPFTEAVVAKTNGAVKFEIYPAGQLGKDQLSLLQYGVADVALLVPSLQTDKFPLSSVSELPGLYSSACEATRKLASIAQDGEVLGEAEMEPNGVQPLYFYMIAPYPLLTINQKVSDLKDLSGLKIRANGAAIGDTFRALGAVAVQVGATDLYNAATRGTVDGAYFPYTAIPSYSLEKVFRYSLDGLALGSGGGILSISERVWGKLSSDVKKIMLEEAAVIQESLCAWLDNDNQRMRDVMVKERGMELTVVSQEVRADIEKRTSAVSEDWAKKMDSAGRKGTAVLNAFKNANGAR